ncbi:MAG: uracil phosphoribosyltransferase [Rhizobiales bacterium NRL2]|jgi:uracil phosphoribosyltransferase|nr:MAG: uracil phosphoribosyltransferase [Rhizobiales bacterium NRL2]
MTAAGVTVVEHPVAQHKLTLLRRAATPPSQFRRTLRELGALLAYEALRDLPVAAVRIETPVAEMDASEIAQGTLAVVSILRAGNGLADGVSDLLPDVPVGHIGLRRNETTLKPERYYLNLPRGIGRARVLLVDPMLATGGSAADAIDQLRAAGVRELRFVCVLAAPEGLAHMAERHPDVPVVTAAIDNRLNEVGYIVPGLGDAGDRLYGTV